MSRTLTIFIDGLPFDQLHKMPHCRTAPSQARLVPILGYSVNCQTQLFTGKTPDELGFWCEWTYAPDRSPYRRLRPLLRLASVAERSYALKRVGHRVIDRLRLATSTKNIPYARLADFAETGHSVFNPAYRGGSLLDLPQLHKFLHLYYAPIEERDERALAAALAHIESRDDPGHMLITWTRIDHCSHWDGVASPPYDEMLARNDRNIETLSRAFLAKAPDGVVFVVSDHGMVNVEHHLDLEIERHFGRPTRSTYSYFTEGTILRVWCHDDALRERMQRHFDGVEGLERVTERERREYGITTPAFGDLIYCAAEGYQIVPSYWGPKPSAGMHGYHPRHASQHGICLSSRPGDFAGEIGANDFYAVLSRELLADAA